MDAKKVLVICQGYNKSAVIRGMLPWEELGYRLIIGLNSYYSISAIRKINPDALIVVDYVPGQTIGAVLEMYRHASFPMRIVLVPYEPNIVSEEDRKSFQVIAWDDLSAENLRAALETIFDDPESYDRGILPEYEEVDSFRLALEKLSRLEPLFPVLLIRALFRDPIENEIQREQAEKVMWQAINDVGGGYLLREDGGSYCLVIDLPTTILSDGFWHLNGVVEDLQNHLSHLADTQVILFLSEIVGNRSIPDEYEKLVSLEPYAFFHSHHDIQSAMFIQRHTVNNDVPLDEVYAQYLPLLKALICDDEKTIRERLEYIYLQQLKLYQNMAFYRLVRSQLQAIYGCACCINDAIDPDHPVRDSYWSIEEALDGQIGRFTAQFPVKKGRERTLGKLTSGALELILQHYNRPIYAAAIAEKLEVSEAHLSRTFKKDLGIGITECIRYVRVYTSAMDLLSDPTSIRDVAQKHGFEDPKYFNKVFRKVMGKNPTEWLREQKQTEEA